MENIATQDQFVLNSNLIILLIVFFILGIIFTFIIMKYQKTFKTKRNLKRGEIGEHNAINILQNYGFSIIKAQPKGKSYMWVDGNMKTLNIRADFLVVKNGVKYICEVKTGKVVGDATYKNTRRQLLEYYLYFELPVIFVDVMNNKISRIEFALPE